MWKDSINKLINEEVVKDVINNYIESKCMLKEYKNPQDSETIRACTDMLENVYNKIIGNGASRNEYSLEKLGKIIAELRKLEEQFKM